MFELVEKQPCDGRDTLHTPHSTARKGALTHSHVSRVLAKSTCPESNQEETTRQAQMEGHSTEPKRLNTIASWKPKQGAGQEPGRWTHGSGRRPILSSVPRLRRHVLSRPLLGRRRTLNADGTLDNSVALTFLDLITVLGCASESACF